VPFGDIRLEIFHINQETTEIQALVCINPFFCDILCIFLFSRFLLINLFSVCMMVMVMLLQICLAREDIKGVILKDMNLVTAFALLSYFVLCGVS